MAHKARLSEEWLPRWLLITYTTVTLCLIPWIVLLSFSLPSRHVAIHWDIMWAGFDIALLIVMAATAYFGAKRSPMLIISASASAALLTMDAWFDILTSRPGHQLAEAVMLASVAEIPLAIASIWLAYKTVYRLAHSRPRP